MSNRLCPSSSGPSDTTAKVHRRRFLAGVCALSSVLAGCTGDSDGDSQTTSGSTPTPEPSSTPEQSPTPTATQTPTDTETPAETGSDLAELDQQIREFFTLQEFEFFGAARERVTETLAQDLPQNEMKTTWQQIREKNGAFVTVDEIRHQETTEGVEVFKVETVFQAAAITFKVAMKNGKVDSFFINDGSQYTWKKPEYVDTSAFEENSVTLDATDSCDLGGTLSVPTGEETVPGVVIVHGSGPSSRDGFFGPNRPYKELAWGLASRDVAVLRYDKRTFACELDSNGLTVDEGTTDDAVTALGRLRAHERVDPGSLFVVGHSLGGALAPRIAKRDGNLAGAVLLAPGPARPIADTLLEQNRYITEQRALPKPQREQLLENVRAEIEQIRSLDIGEEGLDYVSGSTTFFESLAAYDGPETAAALDLPMLLGQGDRDYQVTPDGDFQVWKEALSGQSGVRFKLYEGLNHLFQDGTGKSTPSEYYDPAAVFARRVIEDIVQFIDQTA